MVETHNRAKTQEDAAEEKKGAERKDYLDTWTLLLAFAVAFFTGLLVIVGGFGVWAALRTLRAIQAQVTAVVQSERAWLVIRPEAFKLEPCNRFNWAITNSGRTTASITEANVRCRKYARPYKLPTDPDYKESIIFANVPIVPNDSLKAWSYIEVRELEYDYLTTTHINDIRDGEAELIVYGFVKYLDSFGNQRESRFCDYYAPFCDEFRINLQAPAEYQRCT